MEWWKHVSIAIPFFPFKKINVLFFLLNPAKEKYKLFLRVKNSGRVL